MRELEMETWSRRSLFKMFAAYQKPYFSISADLDLSKFLKWQKAAQEPFFLWIVYLVSRAANESEAFRLRIRGEKVVIHDMVHPSFTMMKDDGEFGICQVSYQCDGLAFISEAKAALAAAKKNGELPLGEETDELLFITSLPWFSFNSISHAMKGDESDCIPRIAWGKYEEREGKWMMTIAVQVHHALADGAHIAAFLRRLQELLDQKAEK